MASVFTGHPFDTMKDRVRSQFKFRKSLDCQYYRWYYFGNNSEIKKLKLNYYKITHIKVQIQCNPTRMTMTQCFKAIMEKSGKENLLSSGESPPSIVCSFYFGRTKNDTIDGDLKSHKNLKKKVIFYLLPNYFFRLPLLYLSFLLKTRLIRFCSYF